MPLEEEISIGAKARILVIDDDPMAVRITSVILKAQGYEVFSASDGAEGIKKVQELKPDLIVLDVMMVGVSGYDVCRHLQRDPDTASIAVLMLSAAREARDHTRGFNSGAMDYLVKPVEPEELVRRAKALLWAGGLPV